MKIALIGASGAVGSRVLAELTRRGHEVTAIARNIVKIPARAGVTPRTADVFDEDGLVQAITGHDAVISAVWFTASDQAILISAVRRARAPSGTPAPNSEAQNLSPTNATDKVTAPPESPGSPAGAPRYLVVGGAGSLYAAPGLRLYDSPEFPKEWVTEAKAGGDFLALLQQAPDLDWTFLSPSADLFAGAQTGRFRLGGDDLLRDASGKSSISIEDYAVALVDELENPTHTHQRFTVGY